MPIGLKYLITLAWKNIYGLRKQNNILFTFMNGKMIGMNKARFSNLNGVSNI